MEMFTAPQLLQVQKAPRKAAAENPEKLYVKRAKLAGGRWEFTINLDRIGQAKFWADRGGRAQAEQSIRTQYANRRVIFYKT